MRGKVIDTEMRERGIVMRRTGWGERFLTSYNTFFSSFKDEEGFRVALPLHSV
jgi:hypothetical protein